MDIVPIAWTTVVNGIGSGIIVADAQDRVVDMSAAAARMTGWPVRRAVGCPVREVLQSWPALADVLNEKVGGKARGTAPEEIVREVGDGAASFEFRFLPLPTARGGMVGRLIVIDDVTERKRVHEELVAQQRALAALGERERLARDLHDSLGQVLGFLNAQAQAARAQLSSGNSAVAVSYLESIAAVAQDAHREVMENIRTMRGTVPLDWRFVSSLELLARRLERNYGIRTDLVVPEEVKDGVLGRAVEMQLLRIIQEAMANARRHGGARHVCVSIAVDAEGVDVVVRDDGRGFDTSRVMSGNGRRVAHGGERGGLAGGEGGEEVGSGCGLGIMRERAAEVGGRVDVRSSPGHGTEVRVHIPRREHKGREVDENPPG